MMRAASGSGWLSTRGFYPPAPVTGTAGRITRNTANLNFLQVTLMRLAPLVLSLAFAVLPMTSLAQQAGLASDEQVLLNQVNTDKKALYAANLGLTEEESAKFWPIYDEYERAVKPYQDRLLANVNNFAVKYDTLTAVDAAAMLKEKMAIEKGREELKQKYTAKVAKVLPPKKALRYAQLETRIQLLYARDLYSLIPLAR
jgi:Spy/CpxP family protein refolding chaperone